MTDTAESALWARRYGRDERYDGRSAAVRLVCFPHAGASASTYFPLAAALPAGIDVLGVQYPGRQDRFREPCVESITVLAERVHRALRPLLDRPFAFFGHSMGAMLAHEVARLAAADGGPQPSWLGLSGRRAPSVGRDERLDLDDDAVLVREILRTGGTDRRVVEDPELLALLLPAVRADYRAVASYTHVPGPPLSVPVTVFTGEDDPKVTVAEADAWSAFTTGGFDLRVFPGGHFFLHDDGPRAEVARIVAEALRGVSAAPA
jgi:pyochelin biosynthesis protein PchC